MSLRPACLHVLHELYRAFLYNQAKPSSWFVNKADANWRAGKLGWPLMLRPQDVADYQPYLDSVVRRLKSQHDDRGCLRVADGNGQVGEGTVSGIRGDAIRCVVESLDFTASNGQHTSCMQHKGFARGPEMLLT